MGDFNEVTGATESEGILIKLCRTTFLSLWSFPNVYKDQFNNGCSGDGKEICDLLVVCGDDIIIFSDKRCEFGRSPDLHLNWRRWYRRAIHSSAKQLMGARRWISTYPSRVFTDKDCKNPLPIDLPEISNARFHLVVVASGAKTACQSAISGSGSLILNPNVKGESHVAVDATPFVVGEVVPGDDFIHVLDEVSLQILLKALDTVTDFVDYLTRKVLFIRSRRLIYALGEENLLAHYLQTIKDGIHHDFVFPDNIEGVVIEDGPWHAYCHSDAVLRKSIANCKSYLWDRLIEHFIVHVANGALTHSTVNSLSDFEVGVRLMAKESRLDRRILADAWLSQLDTAPDNQISIRVVTSKDQTSTVYVFLRMPRTFVKANIGYADFRRKYLSSYLLTVPRKFPKAQWIVGIGTDSNYHPEQSHDMAVLEAAKMTEKDEQFATQLLAKYKQFRVGGVRAKNVDAKEYPSANNPAGVVMKEPPRNATCPCGSGKKYKKCCRLT